MMAVTIYAHFGTMLRLASDLGKARQSGDEDAIAKAQSAHYAYKEIMLQADTTILGIGGFQF